MTVFKWVLLQRTPRGRISQGCLKLLLTPRQELQRAVSTESTVELFKQLLVDQSKLIRAL